MVDLNQVLPAVQFTVVSVLTQTLLVAIIIAPLTNVIKRLWRRVSSVIDSLDPSKPVGITEQLKTLEREVERLRDAR